MDGLAIFVIVFIVAALLGITPGVIAQKKGHDFLPWWLFGALLFIVALPLAILLEPERPIVRGAIRNCHRCGQSLKPTDAKCGRCGEPVTDYERWQKTAEAADDVAKWASENQPEP